MPTPRHLFDPAAAAELVRRVHALGPASERQWGRMTAPQMLAHCAITLEWALGESHPPRMLVGRLFGALARRRVFRDDTPIARNTPTAPQLVIHDPHDLAEEQARVTLLIERFAEGGAALCTTHPHTFFGPLTPDQWAILMYKHLDHHLRQFGV